MNLTPLTSIHPLLYCGCFVGFAVFLLFLTALLSKEPVPQDSDQLTLELYTIKPMAHGKTVFFLTKPQDQTIYIDAPHDEE